jgi:hypothetical protein
MRRILALHTAVALLASAQGCGQSDTVWVTGKLLKGGAKYVPPDDQRVSVTFVALGSGDGAASEKTAQAGDTFFAEVDQSSATFTVTDSQGQGIPPGKYRVAVTQKLKREAYDAKPQQRPKRGSDRVDRESDMFKSLFGVAESPIVVTIKGSTEVEVDLDKWRPEAEQKQVAAAAAKAAAAKAAKAGVD